MLRGIAWIAKLVAAGLIISFLSIWTTGYIVTSYVESVLKQFELPIEVPPMAMSGVWGKLWGSDPLMTGGATVDEDEGNAPDKGNGSADGAGNKAEPDAEEAFGQTEQPPLTDIGIGGGSEAGGGAEAPGGGTEVQEGVAGAGTNGEAGGTEGTGGIDGTETAVTEGELTETKDKMSEEDKNKLFEMLLTKLPQESMQQISAYMEEGLTEQELTNIQQIMAQHLDKEEYESMMDILKKY
ncbi:hypothetical protein RB620_21045 [Paenibacillus sp. LHD-117]|uniref:hypothetical protein n=1 Tax=Paenibacillus sp. LHD-117 TaxID=3071412 RepID=UPI0027E1A469|nr:hypothetical protein [Paenibacillus sp. LHD-117]MDQ6421919.1 hypothetical protein [Paenibacillus sp. LHD-117]